MVLSAEQLGITEREPEEEIQQNDFVEFKTSSHYFNVGDHAQVRRVDQDGFLVYLLTPKVPMPSLNDEHWVPRDKVKKFIPLGQLPYHDN